ncbi:hypothetical protein [Pontibacter fetidus]|uniref:Late embryogenesis abundant protein n=1 Tax=Pontibacter fetidus TaxID=2700082 RepID=A0A6B2H6S7_9BACT|nr:hypothetical protein [Pontibacter fetidus]NDK56556.1 hypothetical protein [Pontibacter fetidus]
MDLKLMNYKTISTWLAIVALLITFSCKQATDLKAFTEANYSLQGIENLQLNGINVTDKRTPFDFKTAEGDSLLNAFTTNKLNATTTLFLHVEMPEPEVTRIMQVTNLEWQLLVDGHETLMGTVQKPLDLKNGLNKLPLSSTVTLAEVEGLQNYEGFSTLTTLIAKGRDVRNRLTFRIKPTIKTPVGNVTLPDYITVGQPAGS